MAHWIGRIAAESFGFEPVCVAVWEDASGPRMYGDPAMPTTVPLADLARIATADDLLICNPSFSNLGLGRIFPGRSICYVQGLRTFELLDQFTHYVSVSRAAAAYLALIYKIETRVIPPFLSVPPELAHQKWADKASSMLVLFKPGGQLQQVALDATLAALGRACPYIPLTIATGYDLTQREYLERLSGHRFVVAFSAQEGFGLTPLEAMACGAVVLGLNGVGGRDYMRSGDNCLTVEWSGHERIATLAAEAVSDPTRCEQISQAAVLTAAEFTLDRFKANWRNEIAKVLA